MEIRETTLAGVLLMVPTPHRDDRGVFTRTFDLAAARDAGITGSFLQDSQSRSAAGVLRGMHTRTGAGEAKLVRCARGAVHDVLVDARPDSPTFGTHEAFRLNDNDFHNLYVPAGMLHGFLALTDADVCYRIDAEHDPAADAGVRFDDPELAIAWPRPPRLVGARDTALGSWAELVNSVTTRR